MRLTLTRVVAFHATHRYWKPEWTAEANAARFGWTAEAPGHGHLYRVETTVTGPLDPATRMILDLPVLDALLAERVVTPLAGRHLNDAVPAFANGSALPTCEAIAAWIWEQLAPGLPPGVTLARVRVAEDDTLWAECLGST